VQYLFIKVIALSLYKKKRTFRNTPKHEGERQPLTKARSDGIHPTSLGGSKEGIKDAEFYDSKFDCQDQK